MQLPSLLFGLVCLCTTATAAFVGLGGVRMNDPACAYACRASFASAPLSCSGTGHGDGHSHGAPPTSPDCRAGDTPFLTSLAYCISTKCNASEVPVWQLEQYWALQTTGDPSVPPKWDYATAVRQVTDSPHMTYTMGSTLNHTSLVDPDTYAMQERFMLVFEKVTTHENRYTLAIVIVGFSTPILITLLGKLPFMTRVLDKLNPYLVYPSTVGTYHVRSLPWLLGNPPTMGQALYIAMFFIFNLVLSIVGYDSAQPHPWGYNKRGEILAYAGYRTGHIAFALLPMVILFSGRNNILLWASNWTRSTFLVLHRWVARIFAIQTILHSIFLLAAYNQSGIYAANVTEPYWQWGIVGTVFVCAMLVFSLLWVRQLAYELFLIAHIIMAVFVVVGSWYHLYYRFGLPGNYEYWLYFASAVWFFDRLVRVLRIAKNGVRRATITDLGPNHVRVDIHGFRWAGEPGFHAYAYFPTLSPLRPWENHPFSINPTSHFRSPGRDPLTIQGDASGSSSAAINDSPTTPLDIEKCPGTNTTKTTTLQPRISTPNSPTTAGITLIIRKSTGLTKHLQPFANLPILIDGPYRSTNNTHSTTILRCDRLLLLSGGIGITSLLAYCRAGHPNVKLAWSLKASADAVRHEIVSSILADSDSGGVAVEREILVGRRLDVKALLAEEGERGWGRVGVVVCGPGGLCDDVRDEVARLGRRRGSKTVFELEVVAFSW